jgi:hypothetical protein
MFDLRAGIGVQRQRRLYSIKSRDELAKAALRPHNFKSSYYEPGRKQFKAVSDLRFGKLALWKVDSVPDAGPMDRANRRHSSRASN